MIDRDAIIVIAQATALPGKEAALKAAIDAVIPPSLAEPGISIFRLHENLEKSGHYVLYERFADQAALDSHFASSHFKKVVDAVTPLVGGGKPDITKLRQLTE
jgi:quinol monooxygenase YgiN